MPYIIHIKRDKVVRFAFFDPQTEKYEDFDTDGITTKDFIVYDENGTSRGDFLMECYRDYMFPYIPNQFSVGRKLSKYKKSQNGKKN